MDELIKLVMQKTGLPEGTARTAVETVVNYIKTKLPESIAAQLDGLLSGGGLASELGSLGKLFG